MSSIHIERREAFRSAIEAFIKERLDAKLEKLEPDDPARADLIMQHAFDTWITDAARRVTQIQIVTHTLKPIHPDAKGTNIFRAPRDLPQHVEAGSHSLGENYSSDVVGNAAALDVYKFLKLSVYDRSLLVWMQAGDADLGAAISGDTARAAALINAFTGITSPRDAPLSSHSLAKQVYWLAGADPSDDSHYHLLAPLYSSALAHTVYQTINEDRFGENGKLARQARRARRNHDCGYNEYPGLAVQKMGGTKPQNISQLNSERGGNNYLLSSCPPSIGALAVSAASGSFEPKQPLSIDGLLIFPQLRVQNANAISSQMTHGFPSMTAFIGLMWALARKVKERGIPITLCGVGVICHGIEEQVSSGGYVKSFRLTRNPLGKDGRATAIVERGRMHMDITIVFGVTGGACNLDDADRSSVAKATAGMLESMRIAGGSLLPSGQRSRQPSLEAFRDGDDNAVNERFAAARDRWRKGLALVCRDDLLHDHLDALRNDAQDATQIDALLDLSRVNWRPTRTDADHAEWAPTPHGHGIVPIPLGYGALGELQPAGSVANARDRDTPFRFVESLYGIGQWLSPHRLHSPQQLLWYADSRPEDGLYRCRNDYRPTPAHEFDFN